MNTYKLTLIAVLAAMAVVGRYAFQFIPNIQPVTAIIIIAAFFLGPLSGILLAALTTYLSNMVLGMGLWTIWQIIAWSLIGLFGGILGKLIKKYKLPVLIVYALVAGYFYGLVMALVNYIVAGKFLSYYILGLPFDTYHAAGNVLFMIVLFPVLSKVFERYLKKNASQ